MTETIKNDDLFNALGLPSRPVDALLAIMARLRDPVGGCAWDQAQSCASIAPHTVEEAYEFADAVATGDVDAMRDELGDLLMQVVFHAQINVDDGHFDFEDVARTVAIKMIERHPHVFVGDRSLPTPDAVADFWEDHKAKKRKTKGTLDEIAPGLCALKKAHKFQQRAARVGFDWPETAPILDKIVEEVDELKAEMVATQPDLARIQNEVGDVLFSVVNLARRLNIDAELALRGANNKFERRFREIERRLEKKDMTVDEATLEQMDTIWDEIKRNE
ncbi:MAG: nucleoside triphosphate pyrophosphohydrolase [Pseudomonadota bacterium]|nr:nucleoside triphosphate pyrophosphohydrolase [Pseudomonadota bacterium]